MQLNWLKKEQRTFMERGYLEYQTPEDRYQEIANTIQKICDNNDLSGNNLFKKEIEKKYNYTTKGIGKRFENYITNNWISFASPILSNFGKPNNLNISCNHGMIPDTLDGILAGVHEVGMLAKYGAGTAKNFSNIRGIGEPISTGGKSEGVMEWIEMYAHTMSKVTQGSVRRGFLTAYLSVDHPEIMEFLEIGTKKFTDQKAKFFQQITTAVTIPKGWMNDLIDGKKINRSIWRKIHETRNECGYPYILFEENCNKNSPQVYKDKGVWLNNGNICIEAIEYCDEEKEFACCLSSVNLYWYDDWKNNPNFLIDCFVMLDCNIEEYIEKGSKLAGLEKAVKFAKEHRAIGLGTLGFHSLLQKNMIPFGDFESFLLNNSIFKQLREKGEIATQFMAEMWGEPEYLRGYNRRNTSLMAQAPTKSTSFIMGGTHMSFSEGVDPRKSNYNEKTLAKIQVEDKNPILKKLLIEKGYNTRQVWKSILINNGSVQHLDFLSNHEKNVFKTFPEVSQADIISLAAQRQQYIDMGQSINLMIHPHMSPKDINILYLTAYDKGLKSLYYQYSINAAQEFNKEMLTCSSCEA